MRGVLAQGLGERWLAHMRRGEMVEAWRVGDAVLRARAGRRCDALPRHLQWIWSGERLEGKRVLVRCYHGLGDTIQFVRYAPLLRAIAARVIVWAQPALLPLLRSVRGIDELLARLFRQRRAGEWAAVIDDVTARLGERVGARAGGAAR